MKAQDRLQHRLHNELQAGLFIVIALVMFAASIWVLGRERQIFATQYQYYTSFKDVKGLSHGAAVRLGGITIGRVDKISFGDRYADPNIYVTLLINDEFTERMREDSLVTIETQGLLGDRFVSINTGSGKVRLGPGSTLKSAEPADIGEVLAKAGQVVDRTAAIAKDMNDFVGEFKAEALDSLVSGTKSVSNIAKEIEKGRGLLHTLVYSKKDGEELMGGLREASKSIADLTKAVKDGDGLLHSLIYTSGGGETIKSLGQAAESLATTATHISEIATQVKEGQGLLHQVVYGDSPEGMGEILTKLNSVANNLERASQALSQGSGTLGALLIDSKLYDNLVEVTDDAKRSVILRHAIKSSLNQN